MGSPEGEAARSDEEYGGAGGIRNPTPDDEGPQHEVTISRPFYLGIHPVTQEQYQGVMGANPSYFSPQGLGSYAIGGLGKYAKKLDTRSFPVEEASWNDAVTFCRKLSELPEEKRRGRVYRLPTEAEWEYACRGGAHSSTPFYFGNSLSSAQANFGRQVGRTTTVGSYPANAFGLHDMHGNVCELCQDWYAVDYYANSPKKDPQDPSSGQDRVRRGGSCSAGARDCRSASRFWMPPDYRHSSTGFRVALTVAARTL